MSAAGQMALAAGEYDEPSTPMVRCRCPREWPVAQVARHPSWDRIVYQQLARRSGRRVLEDALREIGEWIQLECRCGRRFRVRGRWLVDQAEAATDGGFGSIRLPRRFEVA